MNLREGIKILFHILKLCVLGPASADGISQRPLVCRGIQWHTVERRISRLVIASNNTKFSGLKLVVKHIETYKDVNYGYLLHICLFSYYASNLNSSKVAGFPLWPGHDANANKVMALVDCS